MANKINSTYWGAENTYITITNRSFKVPDYMYPDVIANHSELLNTSYDKSVMIWGIPSDSSAGSTTVFSWWWDSATETGKIKSEIFSPNIYTFSPATITSDDYRIDYWYAKGTSPTIDGINILQRTSPDTSIISTSVVSTQVASGQYVGSTHKLRVQKTTGSNYDYLLNTQVAYFPYNLNVFRAFASLSALDFKTNAHTIHTFRTSDLSTDFDTIYDAIKTDAGNTGMTDDDVTVIGAGFMCYDTTNINNNRSNHAAANPHITVSTGIEYSDRANNISCNGAEKQKFMSFGRNDYIGYGAFISNLTKQNCDIIGLPAGSVGVPKENKYFNDSTSYENGYGKFTDGFIRLSRKHQSFSDVAYHWEIGITINGKIYNIEDSETITLENMQTPFNISSIIPYMVIDDDKGETRRNALRRAVMHELAFFGVAFCTSHSIAINERWNSSSENIYIPLFDEHMCTTGEYVTLKQAYTANLPQSQWGDVFGAQEIIDNYDPDYQPEPEPPTPVDGDSGNLENTTMSQTYFKGSNKYYLVNDATLANFISTINSMYVNDGDDTQMKLDFKGSNPNDYIVGIYGIPIDLLAATVGDTIHIGPVDTTISAATLDPSWQHQISFGELPIPAFFGDFRDYEPYTTIELYIPLCGTVQLDCTEYIGHTVKVDGIFDLQTGELTCRVIRKSELGDTVTHTINGSIWVEIPVSARDMGSFQNNQHQIKMALIQTGFNQISKTVSRAGTDINSAVNLAQKKGKFKGDVNLNGLNAVTVTGDAIQTGLDTANLMYQLTHTPAPISQTSTASTSVGVMMYNQAKLFIKRCKMLPDYDESIYAHTIGHACLINTTINDVVSDSNNKLIVCGTSDLTGISATTPEIQAIQTALASGIYV